MSERRHLLPIAQANLDAIIANGRWGADTPCFPLSWLPFESAPRRWNATRGDAAIFDGAKVVVVGSSTMRELALHWHYLTSGAVDESQLPTDSSGHVYNPADGHRIYRDCSQATRHGYACITHRCNATVGYGCHDCWCCCGRPSCARHQCTGADFTLRRVPPAPPAPPRASPATTPRSSLPAPDAELTFSWKPDLLATEADRRLFATRLCPNPPDILVIGSKGVLYYRTHTHTSRTAATAHRWAHPSHRAPWCVRRVHCVGGGRYTTRTTIIIR